MAVQYDLSHYYRQTEGTQDLSPTLQSSELLTPQQIPQRPTVSPERYGEYRSSTPAVLRLPWGREREYGGIGAVSLPPDQRPKTEPPPLEAKGHKHYGYGGDPWPRGLPIQQYYDLTDLKKSAVRASDDLYPKPPAASLSEKQIEANFPAEHPYHSHISKFAVFPSFRPADEPMRCHTPLHPQTPACGHPTLVLKKTKGNPYRHEVITIPSDSQKVALTWPGQQGYYHFPKFHNKNCQIYYPSPPKTVAPNPLYKTYEETPSDRTLNLQRNLIKSQWLTTYTRNFTGRGEMNPLQLDDYYEKVIGNITGKTDENTEMKPAFLSSVLQARPIEGRIARLLQGRRILVKKEEPESETVECKTNSHDEVETVNSSCTSDTYGNIVDTNERKNTKRLSSTQEHMEPDLRKITDTEKTDALYRRQLTPAPTPYDSEYKPVHEKLPGEQNLNIVCEKPSEFNKPFLKRCFSSQEACSRKPLDTHSVIGQYVNQNILRAQNAMHSVGKTLPCATLLELQDSFSRSAAHKTFQQNFPEKEKDLRENCHSGRKHNFYGFRSIYSHN
ncbi:sperm-associated microtubule inner protein 4 [Pyxicephalus adspersus]|uniref:Uncharacterized protein n=1 Tax=Pyxicephalus adspersus TaxID=30357 RepID=A0AAV3AIC2_PYXAD|nr:TPA: hypothetical protein GDO54_012581 [Pyxicephalus adspersus]DBA25008.1 TPA: hypothetical protein GDO54_012581 [Pyxicephalus adspersus]